MERTGVGGGGPQPLGLLARFDRPAGVEVEARNGQCRNRFETPKRTPDLRK
jgi:hypothetical protein